MLGCGCLHIFHAGGSTHAMCVQPGCMCRLDMSAHSACGMVHLSSMFGLVHARAGHRLSGACWCAREPWPRFFLFLSLVHMAFLLRRER